MDEKPRKRRRLWWRSRSDPEQKPLKRIWVQHVAVGAEALATRLNVAEARGLQPDAQAVAAGVRELLRRASHAALRYDPIPGRWWNWWRGTLVEAAYRNLHAARAQIVDLYDEADLRAEVPSAVARAQSTIHREDPRSIAASDLEALPPRLWRARLRCLIEDGYEALDQQHAQLRNFRNIVLLSALSITLLVGAVLCIVAFNPSVMPLCFPHQNASGVAVVGRLSCPTRENTDDPSGGDALVVALLGLLGGALAASVSIHNLKGTATPYDVPVALAMLKVPLGAFTAIVGIVAIQGDFVPGLSRLDSQGQILSYALLFGFAQQVFTRLLDQRAQTLLSGIPSRDVQATPAPPTHPAVVMAPQANISEAANAPSQPAAISAFPEELLRGDNEEADADGEVGLAVFLPNPNGDDAGQTQDDLEEMFLLPDAPERDTR